MAEALPTRTYWLHRPWWDGVFILLPPFLAVLITILLPAGWKQTDGLPLAAWVALVLCIDVAHVYSTLYRTYFVPEALERHRTLLLLTPLVAWLGGVVLYALGSEVFWRAMAYLAVFHFVRQQYGLLKLYTRFEPLSALRRRWEQATVYLATGFPLVYWHTHPRRFVWFVAGDFFQLSGQWLVWVTGVLYGVAVVGYLAFVLADVCHGRQPNWPKHLLVLGTALSWYLGIVVYNGDMAFTLTNVVTHGVPYLALVWVFARKDQQRLHSADAKPFALPLWLRSVALFLGILLLLAFVEEGLWDGFVWRDHTQFFAAFAQLPELVDPDLLTLAVPTLSLPQVTHYLLDGFIWRRTYLSDTTPVSAA